MTTPLFALCVPDDHYERIVKLIDESEASETLLKDKAGITQRFYRDGDEIFADKEESDGNVLKQKVMTMSEAQKMANKDNYRMKIESRVKEDFPDMSEEDIKAHADVLNEANESVKRLIANGMPKAMAVKLISLIVEGNKEFSSPEELAEFMKEVSTEPEPKNEVVDDGGELASVVKNIIISSQTLPCDE
jgi:hypothetical protein